MSDRAISRRDLFRRGGKLGGLVAVPALLRPADTVGGERRPAGGDGAPDVYGAIGVRPLINARGTYTIISGSVMLPEVRAAMEAAARRYVHLDELTDAIGARLAALTGAEWGMVSSGCAAGLTHATAACVAGGNPDLHIRIPNLAGFPKDEVIIPSHSRNVYDAAIRAVGTRVLQVSTPSELEAALGPRTAMIYVLAGPRADESPINLRAIAQVAGPKSVPILVDAAAEILTIPNVHLQKGATLVAYSGGKCLRGPQTAGLVLGRKDLVQAAWVHSAPHHGFARGMKVGKEEAIGMLAAVESWVKRDHDAEWTRWNGWLTHIAERVSRIEGITTTAVLPEGLSNKTPSLHVTWERARFGITGEAVMQTLFDTDPRVALFAIRGNGDPAQTGVSVTPYMLAAGEERIVADRLYAVLKNPPAAKAQETAATPAGDLTGQWDVQIRYAASSATHTLHLRQRGNDLDGAHRGEFITRDLTGTIHGDAIRFRSAFGEEHGDALSYTFTGTLSGEEMGGALDMGEYLKGTWTARRRVSRRG